jgi:iron complex transport system ATP-binding protein
MKEREGIEVRNLTLGYGERPIIRGLNLTLPQGKISVIIGSNGCGKSTLLKGLGRILRPQGGSVRLNGIDVQQTPAKDLAKQLAILPQTPKAPGELTAEELVGYGRFPHKRGFGGLNSEDYRIIRESMDITGVEAYRNAPLYALSGGQRQRVWIAMTLCQQAEYMLLDEPATYLDMAHQFEVLSLLFRLNRQEGRTIILVLHELNSAARFADWMVGLKNGSLAAEGTPEQVVTGKNLKTIYDIEAEITKDPKTGRPVCISYETAGGAPPRTAGVQQEPRVSKARLRQR